MRLWLAIAAVTMLSACGAPPGQDGSPPGPGEPQMTEAADVSDAARATRTADGKSGPPPVKVSIPQLAYAYKLGFLVPGPQLAETQDAHRNLCESMGPARCRLLALERGSADDARAGGLIKLRVATSEASSFSKALGKTVNDAGGRTIDTNVVASDVSKQIVDAEARIRQRELLVQRLTEVLRTRKGSVAELLEAERSVAQAQEELDQAKGWVTELRGRVAMSEFDIRYEAIAVSASAQGVGGQLTEAVQDSSAGFLIGLRFLFTLIIYLAPWALLAFPAIWLVRRLRRKEAPAAEA